MNSTEYSPRDLIGYGEDSPDPKWPGGARIAVNFVLNYEEGSEVSPVNGDNIAESLASELGPGYAPMTGGARDVNIESLYEYGSRAGVWRILRLFKDCKMPLTAFAVGRALELNPAVAHALERDGHEIGSHGWRWVDRGAWSAEEEKENVRKAISAIKTVSPSGTSPRGWYYGMVGSKGGERSRALVAQVYKEEGLPLKWYSDDYSDDLPHWIPYPGESEDKGLLIVPYTLDTNDYKNAGYQAFITPDDFASYLIAAFDELYQEGVAGHAKMMSIGLHCRIVGRPARVAGLRKFLEHIKSRQGVWVTTREQIADHWMEKFPYNKP